MKQWLNQHSQPLQSVLTRMRQNFLGTILMCCVIGVTLSLPAVLFTVVDNVERFAGVIESKPQLSLFLKLDTSSSQKNILTAKLQKHPDIAQFEFVSKDSACLHVDMRHRRHKDGPPLHTPTLPFYHLHAPHIRT